MIAIILAFYLLTALWIAIEVYRAPLVVEAPQGLILVEPARELTALLPRGLRRTCAPLFWNFWGL